MSKKVGRKPLPVSDRRKMYSTRLHPSSIHKLNIIKQAHGGKAISRIIESLIDREYRNMK